MRRSIILPTLSVLVFTTALALGSCASNRPLAGMDKSSVLAPVSDDEKRLLASRSEDGHGARPFRPQLASLITGRPAGDPQHFKRSEREPEGRPPLPMSEPPRFVDVGEPLSSFRAKLAALESGQRTKPVVIVHIGDSHIASDSFTHGIRTRLQARFGDAGRGQVIPASAFKYAAAQSVKLASSGSWRSWMSLKSDNGVYGLSGVRVESGSPSAKMELKSDDMFDRAEVTVATGPRQGSFTASVDGKPAGRFSAKAAKAGAKTFSIDAAGKRLTISPVGDGETGVLHWATTRDGAGIRYVNFGQVGATVNVTKRWDAAALANDLKSIDPDLIVYGFGTNEGYDDNVNVTAYRDYVSGFLKTVRAEAGDADLMILGASDGLRRRGGKSCGNGWYQPPKLGALRDAMHGLAKELKAGYWDWSQAMGGPCSIDGWARKGLAAKDRVHLTSKGYDRSAQAFYEALVGPLDTTVVAANRR